MIAISKWASRNPVKSRILLVGCQLLTVANAGLLGLLLFNFDWPASSLIAFLLVNVFGVAYLYYPTKAKRVTKKRYWQQKRCDFVLALSCSLLIAVSVNNYVVTEDVLSGAEARLTESIIVQSAVFTPPTATPDAVPAKAERRAARRQQFKALKLHFKALRTEFRAWKKEHKGQKKGRGLGNALLILLALAIAIGLGILVAALTCSLSCNGQAGLAIVVLITGVTGIVWLSVIAIKAILRRKGREPVDGVFAR